MSHPHRRSESRREPFRWRFGHGRADSYAVSSTFFERDTASLTADFKRAKQIPPPQQRAEFSHAGLNRNGLTFKPRLVPFADDRERSMRLGRYHTTSLASAPKSIPRK